ncbi:MAG: DUF6062 family protein [Lachnospiraceae bacterium]|nr:DUF6062 family protein [Lachnospiraceae bacterium]
MKEKLYTIPLNEAVDAHDECPICFIERKLEQDTIDFVLGNSSSYMESDVRADTDEAGFCRKHFQKMYDYGNSLGNAWILKTHYRKKIDEMKKAFQQVSPSKGSFKLFKKPAAEGENPLVDWIHKENESCYICNRFKDTYDRYMDTFFYLYREDSVFHDKILNSKGFCLTHFGDLCEAADKYLKPDERDRFYKEMETLMTDNMERIYEDVSWFIEKYDYRNRDADWKNSRDAIQRGMQNMKGGYPADPIYRPQK